MRGFGLTDPTFHQDISGGTESLRLENARPGCMSWCCWWSRLLGNSRTSSGICSSHLRGGGRVAGAQIASSRRRPLVRVFTGYILEEADSAWQVTESLLWEQVAAIGCAVATSVEMALWILLKLPITPERPALEPRYVLVYGGATISGTFAIQSLRLQVITFPPFLILKAQKLMPVV